MKLGGGALLFLGSFLDWYGTSRFAVSGTETEFNGLQGIFALIIGLAIVALAAIAAFAPQINLPNNIGGISLDQLMFMLAIGVFLMCFGGLFWSVGDVGPKIGLFLCVAGSAVATAGYFIDRTDVSTSA